MIKWISPPPSFSSLSAGPLPNKDYEEHNRISSYRGYLYKLRRSKNVLAPQWGKRWFSIEGHFLKWYRQENDLFSSGMINLKYVRSISKLENQQQIDSNNSGSGKSNMQYAFSINSDERNVVLRATTLEEMKTWFKVLHIHADKARGGKGTTVVSDFNQLPTMNGTTTATGAAVTGVQQPKKPRGVKGSISLEDELENTLKKLDDLEQVVREEDSESGKSQRFFQSADQVEEAEEEGNYNDYCNHSQQIKNRRWEKQQQNVQNDRSSSSSFSHHQGQISKTANRNSKDISSVLYPPQNPPPYSYRPTSQQRQPQRHYQLEQDDKEADQDAPYHFSAQHLPPQVSVQRQRSFHADDDSTPANDRPHYRNVTNKLLRNVQLDESVDSTSTGDAAAAATTGNPRMQVPRRRGSNGSDSKSSSSVKRNDSFNSMEDITMTSRQTNRAKAIRANPVSPRGHSNQRDNRLLEESKGEMDSRKGSYDDYDNDSPQQQRPLSSHYQKPLSSNSISNNSNRNSFNGQNQNQGNGSSNYNKQQHRQSRSRIVIEAENSPGSPDMSNNGGNYDREEEKVSSRRSSRQLEAQHVKIHNPSIPTSGYGGTSRPNSTSSTQKNSREGLNYQKPHDHSHERPASKRLHNIHHFGESNDSADVTGENIPSLDRYDVNNFNNPKSTSSALPTRKPLSSFEAPVRNSRDFSVKSAW
jgi:hypothetical protein